MSIFGAQPAWVERVWPATRLWHTHVQHAVVVLVLFAGNGYWIGAALPWITGWRGYQLFAVIGLLFYLGREVEAHLQHTGRFKRGELTRAQHRLALWDSRLDFLVPLSITLPVIGHDYGIWQVTGLLWALTITHYLFQPAGQVDGLR